MRENKNNFESGIDSNGKRWICGDIPVRRGKRVYVDTRIGEGVDKILNELNSFISYQTTQVSFPSYSPEDVAQELRLLALEALPNYDISKKTNMITFLQNHVRNRIINLCKFVSEKRRRATYYKSQVVKVRCPKCRTFFKDREDSASFTCKSCYHSGENGKSWKKYNLPVVPVPFGSIEPTQDSGGEVSIIDIISDVNGDMAFVKEEQILMEKRSQLQMDFMKIYDKLDETNQKIITLVIEGYTYKEISKKVGLTDKATYARASKIIKG